MFNLLCNIAILLSTLILGVLTFSKEIAQNTKFKKLNALDFKLLVLILGILLGGIATISKEFKTEKDSDAKTKRINYLQTQLYKNVIGGGFPILRPVISKGVMYMFLQNPDTISIYSITYHFNNKYLPITNDIWDSLVNVRFKRLFSDSIRNYVSQSIIPKGIIPIYEKDLSNVREISIPFQFTIEWRNDSYNVFMTISRKMTNLNDIRLNDFKLSHLEYDYKGGRYNEQQFEAKFYPKTKIEPLDRLFKTGK
jgi:hypothetical protein